MTCAAPLPKVHAIHQSSTYIHTCKSSTYNWYVACMVGTKRSRVWWVHRGVEYGGYTEEQGMVGTHRSRVWWVHTAVGYGGYTEEQGMVGTHSSRV